eukprot:TRINITY_DN1974_c0_g1_i2.p1 TRINITY_DN1974_c0_g1~~TRINITY_DN1974_c0_g1_i2.p1  ORF type:complete len:331 (-),score=-7.89 TRINITY_DN1974_c0_g1_i2:46-1038(-)
MTLSCSFEGCLSSFQTKKELERHECVHIEERPFACCFPNCNWRFKTSSALERHFVIHTGEKVYQCPYCPKVFNRKGNMLSHLLIHEEEREIFQCPHPGCSKYFMRKATLEQHISLHSSAGGRYLCNHPGCNRVFTYSSNLSRHRRSHSGKRSFTCQQEGCVGSFVTRQSLLNHYRLKHPEVCSETLPQCANVKRLRYLSTEYLSLLTQKRRRYISRVSANGFVVKKLESKDKIVRNSHPKISVPCLPLLQDTLSPPIMRVVLESQNTHSLQRKQQYYQWASSVPNKRFYRPPLPDLKFTSDLARFGAFASIQQCPIFVQATGEPTGLVPQ